MPARHVPRFVKMSAPQKLHSVAADRFRDRELRSRRSEVSADFDKRSARHELLFPFLSQQWKSVRAPPEESLFHPEHRSFQSSSAGSHTQRYHRSESKSPADTLPGEPSAR